MPDFRLEPTVGLSLGETIQFALGSWPGEIGNGLAFREDAFDAMEPHLRAVWPELPPAARYAVTELPPDILLAFVHRLRAAARSGSGSSPSQAQLFDRLADWLDAQRDGPEPVSLLGI